MPEPLLSVVIPAYNEGARIGNTLEQIRQYLKDQNFRTELIVVDDGSRDNTLEVVSRFPEVRVVRNDRNHGKGYTVRHGVMEAKGKFILFSDADLSTPIEEAGKLLAAIESQQAAAAIGSRALQRELIGVHQPFFRELGGRFFNLFVRLFTGLQLRDTQCGFKLFRRDVTRHAFELLSVERFGFDPELLFLIERFGGKVIEVPVRWNDNPATKVRFLRDATRMFLDLIVLRWRAWTGKYSAGPPPPG